MTDHISLKKYSNKGNLNVITVIPDEANYILDLGCGSGDNARILKEKGKIVDGVTLSESEAVEARNHCRNVFICNLEEGLAPEIKDKYDAVVCSHVLEHIAYPHKLLTDIHSCLNAKNSRLIVALPNIMAYKYRFKLMMGKFEYENAGVMDYTHLRWYTFKSAQELLISNGYQVEKASTNIGVPFNRLSKYLPNFAQEIIKYLLANIGKSLFGGELLFVVKSMKISNNL